MEKADQQGKMIRTQDLQRFIILIQCQRFLINWFGKTRYFFATEKPDWKTDVHDRVIGNSILHII